MWMFEKSAKEVSQSYIWLWLSLYPIVSLFNGAALKFHKPIPRRFHTSAVNWQLGVRGWRLASRSQMLRALKQHSVCVFAQINGRAADTKLVRPDLVLITERTGISSSGIGHFTPDLRQSWYLQKTSQHLFQPARSSSRWQIRVDLTRLSVQHI